MTPTPQALDYGSPNPEDNISSNAANQALALLMQNRQIDFAGTTVTVTDHRSGGGSNPPLVVPLRAAGEMENNVDVGCMQIWTSGTPLDSMKDTPVDLHAKLTLGAVEDPLFSAPGRNVARLLEACGHFTPGSPDDVLVMQHHFPLDALGNKVSPWPVAAYQNAIAALQPGGGEPPVDTKQGGAL